MGVIRTTFYHCMEYSPIISKQANGLYGLIGSGEGFGRGVRLSSPEHRLGEHS
jgi:hypothetical protein